MGPHRDEIAFSIDGLPARTHASQGEQRSLALALRLASHRLVAQARGHAPILLLDDVFSELDPQRSAALFAALPQCQILLATAAALPASAARPDRIMRVAGGEVEVVSSPPVGSVP